MTLSDIISAYHSTLDGIRALWTIYLTLAGGVLVLWSSSHESTRYRRNIVVVLAFFSLTTTLLCLGIWNNYKELSALAANAVSLATSDADKTYTSLLQPGDSRSVAAAVHAIVVVAFIAAGLSFHRHRRTK